MASVQELGSPEHYKARARIIRMQQHEESSTAYETSNKLQERPRRAIEEKVVSRLTSDTPACELLLALFVASCSSSRRNTICQPFPRSMKSDTGSRFDESLILAQSLPPFATLVAEPELVQKLSLPTLKLLDWIINTEYDGFTLRSLPVDTFTRRTASKTSKRRQQAHALPDYAFEFVYTPESYRLKRFEALESQYGTIMGCHGSLLENFHSIVRFGLDESFGRSSSIYGDGIYLSSDIEVAHSFLRPAAHGIEGMSIGDRIGVVIACDVILHPDDVRHEGTAPSARKSLLDESKEQLPPGYIISTSSHLVLNRYLLVTSERNTPEPAARPRRYLPPKAAVQWLLVLFYVLLLVAIWYAKSKTHRIADIKRLANQYGLWPR